MSITTFIIICNEYGIDPALVAEDLHDNDLEDGLTEERLRLWLESNY